MNIYAKHQGCTPEQTEELLSIIERASECTRIEVFIDPSDFHIWSYIFISSTCTEQFEPSEQYDFTFFLGNEAYVSSSECTVKYEKIALDDFISQAKSIILDLSLES